MVLGRILNAVQVEVHGEEHRGPLCGTQLGSAKAQKCSLDLVGLPPTLQGPSGNSDAGGLPYLALYGSRLDRILGEKDRAALFSSDGSLVGLLHLILRQVRVAE